MKLKFKLDFLYKMLYHILILNQYESTYIPLGSIHSLENLCSEVLIIIEVQCGTYLGEDDIVRYDDIYGRAGTNK